MMNPKAMEALRKARELFAQNADDIPVDAKPVDTLRKPQVVLTPINAPRFTKESIKEEHKKMEQQQQSLATALQAQGKNGHHSSDATKPAQTKQTDKFVGMSTIQATKYCVNKGIKKPADIARETGKPVQQIYTAMWKLRNEKKKAKAESKMSKMSKIPLPTQQADDFNREPTAWEDANMVIFKTRAEYDEEINRLHLRVSDLLIERQELKTIVKYLEGKAHV